MHVPLPIFAEVAGCVRCRETGLLHRNDDGEWARPVLQRDPPSGSDVLIVAEAPNAEDTYTNRRLTYDDASDPTGQFATELLMGVGADVRTVFFTNAVLCLPAERGGKFPVGAKQLNMCRPWLARLITEGNPTVVVTFGTKALAALAGIEAHHLRLRSSVGKLHPWFGRQLLPLYHPGLLGRVSRSAGQQKEDIEALRPILRGGRFLWEEGDLVIIKQPPPGPAGAVVERGKPDPRPAGIVRKGDPTPER